MTGDAPRAGGRPAGAGRVAGSREDGAARCARWREEGRRVVFTNGCFDILHVGHVALLTEARALGDRLVVGLNGDASVRRLKGSGRPVNPAEDRGLVLAALRPVDLVVVFDEDTPLELIEALRPDVLVKGADWAQGQIVGADLVEGWGGSVVRVPVVPGRSTTAVVDRLSGGGEGLDTSRSR